MAVQQCLAALLAYLGGTPGAIFKFEHEVITIVKSVLDLSTRHIELLFDGCLKVWCDADSSQRGALVWLPPVCHLHREPCSHCPELAMATRLFQSCARSLSTSSPSWRPTKQWPRTLSCRMSTLYSRSLPSSSPSPAGRAIRVPLHAPRLLLALGYVLLPPFTRDPTPTTPSYFFHICAIQLIDRLSLSTDLMASKCWSHACSKPISASRVQRVLVSIR